MQRGEDCGICSLCVPDLEENYNLFIAEVEHLLYRCTCEFLFIERQSARSSLALLCAWDVFCSRVNWFSFCKDYVCMYCISSVSKICIHILLEYVWLFMFKITSLWFIFNTETMSQATPARKLEEVLHLAELCIEVLQQNEEHHAEVTTCFNCCTMLPVMLCHSKNNTEEVAYP